MSCCSSSADRAAIDRRRRQCLVIFASLYTFLFVGAFFGWGPMQLLLEENDSFAWKCDSEDRDEGNEKGSGDDKALCPEQTTALVNVQFYAITTQLTSPLLGQIADRYGALALAYLMAVCSWLGLGLLIVAVNFADQLLYPSFIFVALASWMGGLLSVQTGMYFEGHARSRVIFVLNSLFDAGSITYLGLWATREGTGASLTAILAGYFGLSLVVYGAGVYFWKVAVPAEGSDSDKSSNGGDTSSSGGNLAMQVDIMSTNRNASSVDGNLAAQEATDAGEPSENNQNDKVPSEDKDVVHSSENVTGDNNDISSIPPSPFEDQVMPDGPCGYVIVADRTARQQLTSWPFFLVTVIWSIHVTTNQWVLTMTRDFLASLGDDETGNKYLTIFTLLMPASLVAVPCTDTVLLRCGFHGGFQAINALALGYNLIRLLSDSLNLQIVGFVLFSFFRSFFFGVTFSYLPTLLAPTVIGKAQGILFALTGVIAFVNVPLASFAIEDQGGDFFVPNLIHTIAVAPCVVASFGIGRVIRREHEQKKEIEEERLRKSYGGVLLRRSSSPPR